MIDVIIPCWINDEETMALTEAAVASLVPRKRLIVVDNGSTHGGGKMREMADVYVRNKENLGYAKACNQGMKLADDIAVIANNDIFVSPNWWKITEDIIKDPKVATLHFKMLGYTEPFSFGNEVSNTGREKWCSGSFFIKTQKALFDEEFLNSYDDWDYQFRARKAGFCTAYTNMAAYQHKDSHTQLKVVDDTRIERDRKNREHFKSKHGEYPEELFAKLFPEQVNQPWKPMP